jgi:hypothetical protein
MYTYNNKFQTNNLLNTEEYELINQIYKCIECDDTDNIKKLTQKLISIQSAKENIDSINSFK